MHRRRGRKAVEGGKDVYIRKQSEIKDSVKSILHYQIKRRGVKYEKNNIYFRTYVFTNSLC